MLKLRKMWNMKNKKGFTLIEILAVIVLISLIVIIAVPSVKSISAKSKRKLFDTKVKIAEEAVNMWAEANSSCFEIGGNGCGVLEGCELDANGNTKCTVTFEKLALNGIIDYDLVEGDNKYVVDPTTNESMNNYTIDVVLDKITNLVTSSLDENTKVPEKIITTKKGEITSTTSNNNSVAKSVINIDSNGGTYLGNTIIEVVKGEIIDIGSVSKIDYTFIGWKVTSGTATISENKITPSTATVTVQAQFKQNSVITIDPNGGTYTSNKIINSTVGTILDIGAASKTGYTFIGWKLTSGTATISGNIITPSTATVTVQAQFKQNSVITIDSNGGTYTSNKIINSTVGTSLNIGSARKNGYTFIGWKLTSGTATISGNIITPSSSNVTVQAQFKQNSVITIDPNGGVYNGSKNISVQLGDSVELDTIVKSGATFTGWEVTSGTATLVENNITPTSSNVVIKAQFCESFAYDNWDTISFNVRNKKHSCYNVGDKKSVTLTGSAIGLSSNKDFTLVIANKTDTNCSSSDSDCGFVIMFNQIVLSKKMFDQYSTAVYFNYTDSYIRDY